MLMRRRADRLRHGPIVATPSGQTLACVLPNKGVRAGKVTYLILGIVPKVVNKKCFFLWGGGWRGKASKTDFLKFDDVSLPSRRNYAHTFTLLLWTITLATL